MIERLELNSIQYALEKELGIFCSTKMAFMVYLGHLVADAGEGKPRCKDRITVGTRNIEA